MHNAGAIAMISTSSLNLRRAKSQLVILTLGIALALSPAWAASADEQKPQALMEFRANLIDATDVAKFDALTSTQRDQLGSYLIGEIDPFSPQNGLGDGAGGFEIQTGQYSSKTTLRIAALATTATKSISAWQSFVFAGMTISKTTVRETYYVSSNAATSIATYSCIVDVNYDPYSAVTSTKDGAWISAGNATAECLVKVRRGVPTALGQITWSTKSKIQFVTGNGYGGVIAHGWR